MQELVLKSYHNKYDEKKEFVGLEEFDFSREECLGEIKSILLKKTNMVNLSYILCMITKKFVMMLRMIKIM